MSTTEFELPREPPQHINLADGFRSRHVVFHGNQGGCCAWHKQAG